jgi:hypothetical protein
MTGLISFILIALGGTMMSGAGMSAARGRERTSIIGLVVGIILLLCGWWLA